MQAPLREITQPFAPEGMPLSRKQVALQLRRSSEAAERPGGADDAVIRKQRFRRIAKNVADGARRSRPARHARDVAVRRDTSCRNSGDHTQHPPREGRGRRAALQRIASASTRPSARGSVMPAKYANVGAISAGVADVRYRPGLMPQPIRMTGTRWS